jgi:hypothetical protein
MPVLDEAPVHGDQELPFLDGPSTVANDNAAGTARAFENIPNPIGWRGATAMLAASSMMAAVIMLCLLLVTVG